MRWECNRLQRRTRERFRRLSYVALVDSAAPHDLAGGASGYLDHRSDRHKWHAWRMEDGLTEDEIWKVATDFLGVTKDGCYGGDFSIRTFNHFFGPLDDFDDDLTLAGKTGKEWVALVASQSLADQVKILRGLVERCPTADDRAPRNRQRTATKMLSWAQRLESGSHVIGQPPEVTREVVVRALADVEQLARTTGAASAVDRVHTALHGHLLALCEAEGIETQPEATMAAIFKTLRRSHRKLVALRRRLPHHQTPLLHNRPGLHAATAT